MQCKWVEIRDTYLRKGEKQSSEALSYQEQHNSSRLRPIERRFWELGIWGSDMDQLIEKIMRKVGSWKGREWKKEGIKWLKLRGKVFYRLKFFQIPYPGQVGLWLMMK